MDITENKEYRIDVMGDGLHKPSEKQFNDTLERVGDILKRHEGNIGRTYLSEGFFKVNGPNDEAISDIRKLPKVCVTEPYSRFEIS